MRRVGWLFLSIKCNSEYGTWGRCINRHLMAMVFWWKWCHSNIKTAVNSQYAKFTSHTSSAARIIQFHILCNNSKLYYYPNIQSDCFGTVLSFLIIFFNELGLCSWQQKSLKFRFMKIDYCSIPRPYLVSDTVITLIFYNWTRNKDTKAQTSMTLTWSVHVLMKAICLFKTPV